jgi:hypothetical protein
MAWPMVYKVSDHALQVGWPNYILLMVRPASDGALMVYKLSDQMILVRVPGHQPTRISVDFEGSHPHNTACRSSGRSACRSTSQQTATLTGCNIRLADAPAKMYHYYDYYPHYHPNSATHFWEVPLGVHRA